MDNKDDELCRLPIFVYGTLKRGFQNHGIIQTSKFIGTGATRGVLWDLGPFPGYESDETPRQGQSPMVKGEVFHTTRSVLAKVDFLEGQLYNRRIVEVELEDGKKLNAWAYEIDLGDHDTFKFKHVIADGNWTKGEPII